MNRDPLSLFLNEKTAAQSATDTVMDIPEQKPFSKNPDPGSLDPGERALAGMMAVSGSAIGGAATWMANAALRNAALGGTAKATRYSQLSGDLQWPKAKLLGLYDLETRRPKYPVAAKKELESLHAELESATRRGNAKEIIQLNKDIRSRKYHPFNVAEMSAKKEMRGMANTIHSFMEKYDLENKGVKINIRKGPLNSILGPRYETISKRVYLPVINKEIALHELGHAADYTSGRIGKIRRIAEPMLSRGARFIVPAALIAGDRIAETLPGTVDDKVIDFVQANAPMIMGATLAATSLYPEAKASILAIKHISKTEGKDAARKAMKRLGPAFGSYLIGAIPTVVGIMLAKKYMTEARTEKAETDKIIAGRMAEIEKEASVIRNIGGDLINATIDIARSTRSVGRDLAHIGGQIANQTSKIISEPGTIRKLTDSAKHVGTSPEFVQGAFISALPSATAALYLYGTRSGSEIRSRIHPEDRDRSYSEKKKGIPGVSSRSEEVWREQNPKLFAGLVGVGAALSAGVMTKFVSDLARVL